jgi:hypothetical protein
MAVGAVLTKLLTGAAKAASSPAGATIALGAGQALAGAIKQRKADAMIPALEDPEQRAMRNLIGRKRRAYDTGTANNAERTGLRQLYKSGISNAFKYGAGARGLNEMNKMYMQGVFNLNESGKQASNNLLQQESQAVDNIAQRKLDILMTKYDTEQARAAQLKTDGNKNLMVGVASLNPKTNKAQ